MLRPDPDIVGVPNEFIPRRARMIKDEKEEIRSEVGIKN